MEIKDVQKIKLSTDEVLVVEISVGPLSDVRREQLHAHLKKIFPNNNVIITDTGTTFKVISPQ